MLGAAIATSLFLTNNLVFSVLTSILIVAIISAVNEDVPVLSLNVTVVLVGPLTVTVCPPPSKATCSPTTNPEVPAVRIVVV